VWHAIATLASSHFVKKGRMGPMQFHFGLCSFISLRRPNGTYAISFREKGRMGPMQFHFGLCSFISLRRPNGTYAPCQTTGAEPSPHPTLL
jgi:hypothetical protein